MEIPRAVLPKADCSMQPPVWTRTQQVTGDCITTATTPPPSSPAEAIGTPPKPNTVARHSTLRRQSLQPGPNRPYELAPFVASFHDATEASAAAEASGAEDSMTPPTTKRSRKRRRQTCCPDTCGTTAADATDIAPKEATPAANTDHQAEGSTEAFGPEAFGPEAFGPEAFETEAPGLHPSLAATLQFASLHTRITNTVNRLKDIATTRASNLSITREQCSRQHALPSAIHAVNAEVTAELEIVSELSNVAFDIEQLTQLWITMMEYRRAPYNAISRSVEQLIRDAQENSTNEAYRTTSSEASTSAEAYASQAPEGHRRKNTPRKLQTEPTHTKPTQEHGQPTAQPEKDYGAAAATPNNSQ